MMQVRDTGGQRGGSGPGEERQILKIFESKANGISGRTTKTAGLW